VLGAIAGGRTTLFRYRLVRRARTAAVTRRRTASAPTAATTRDGSSSPLTKT